MRVAKLLAVLEPPVFVVVGELLVTVLLREVVEVGVVLPVPVKHW
jgi:hypothetical protein